MQNNVLFPLLNFCLRYAKFVSRPVKNYVSAFHHHSILFCLILFALVGTSSCNQKNKSTDKAKGRKSGPVSVKVIVAEPTLLINTISCTGSILANEKAELKPEISGRIIKINFDEGVVVQKNKLLVKINDSDLQAQLKRNEAQELVLKNDEYQKSKLLEIKAISQDEYDAAKSLLLVNQADRQLLLAQISKTEIHAPFTGKIGLRTISEGNYVVSNTLIATVEQLDPIKIEFEVPEKYSSFIHSGQEINFGTDVSDSVFSAKIYASESSVSSETRTLKVRALCRNQEGILKPGSFARVNMVLEKFPDAIKIPSDAVLTDLEGNTVFICKNGKAQSVRVTTGIRTDSEIQITKGISAGDSLIVTGLLQLNTGSAVLVQRNQDANKAETGSEKNN